MRNKLLIAALLASSAWAQKPPLQPAAPERIETRTRLVAIFSSLNNQLFHAIQQHDSAVFEKLVGEDFELRTSEAPDDPRSRVEWQQQTFNRRLEDFRISRMAVRGLRDDVAIVSFVLEEDPRTPARKAFMVQAWSREGDAWTCQEAYVLPISTKVAPPSPHPKRPSGKD